MNADQQVALLLKFALTIGPIAVYFLALGLLNAQPRPQLLSGRTDFVLLAVVFFPIAIWAMLLVAGLPWIVLTSLVFASAIGFYWMMPRRHSRWVIYNVSQAWLARAIGRALRRIGSPADPTPDPDRPELPMWELADLGLRIRLSSFPMLRNVTCLFERADGQPIAPAQLAPLRRAIDRELDSLHTLPTASAAGFILIGTAMLTAPLLMMANHMDAIVKVVRAFFV